VTVLSALRAAGAGLLLAVALHAGALAQEPAPAQVELGRQLVKASGLGRTFDVMVPQMMVRLEQSLATTRPEVAKDLAVVLDQLEAEFNKNQDEILTTAGRIAARKLSEPEMKETIAFFNTPAGKKYVESQPAMLDELVVAIQGWTEKLSSTMMQRVREEMAKKGHQL
jgi:hypothetical protein